MTHESTGSDTNAQIYVSDYATYNEGRLTGRWMSLDGKSVEEIREEVSQILKENEKANKGQWICEEHMIQDYEGFPREFYSECMIFDEQLEILIQYLELEDYERERFDACLENGYDLEEALKSYEDVAIYEDADEYLEAIGFWHEIPDHLIFYIDEKAVKRDYIDHDGNMLELDHGRLASF